MDLTFTETLSEHRLQPHERDLRLSNPGYGRLLTDHMVTIGWTSERGWHDAELRPYAGLVLDPSSAVLHYGQAIFEGLKAYRQADGSVAAFRPSANARRFNLSAQRMAMPSMPEGLFVHALERLVRADHLWVPDGTGQSLYVRPLLFATDTAIGLRLAPARAYLFVMMAATSGSYLANGDKPLAVWVNTAYPRAFPGGTGEAKFSGNYAASMLGIAEATAHGCDQVVWLDALERRWVEEMGSMNLMFVWDGDVPRIVTPPLTGTLLRGNVRDSLLTLARDLGYAVEERGVDVGEWRRSAKDGTLRETFACGTGAIVLPVGQVRSADGDWTIGDGGPGPVTLTLRDALLGIQEGRQPDRHGWLHRIVGAAA